ncbi:hypothetical protein AB0392_21100 [Nonomuraea angiospora]|uniref:hypothetical protein n=1 Tax=Nonomuraea angiospora TaxID=46172 RepID=UPI00344F1437
MDVADLVPAILTTCSGFRRGEVAGEFGAEPRMAKQRGMRALDGDAREAHTLTSATAPSPQPPAFGEQRGSLP